LPDFLVFVAVLQKLGGAKIILDLHDLMPEFYAEQFQRPLNHPTVRLIRLEEWLSCKFADHIITVTELWRQALIKRGQPAGKISVVMNVADDQIFNRNVQAAPPQDGFFHLIYHGIVGRRQGLDLLLRAMDKIRAEAPNIFLLLHGWGEYRETLMSLAADLQLQDRVDFSLKRLQSEELPALLKQAHLAVVPYRNGVFTGGILPTKLMEYAALGVPSIAARTPGISHYFEDDQVCFFTPENVDELAACILDLYRDRAQLDVLARNIARFPARYEWSRLSSDYVALVERVRSTSRADMQARWSHG
jgi:glycosyltransferase involved in cell wall biosynthesis